MLVPLLALAILAPTDKGSTLYTDCKAFVAMLNGNAKQEYSVAASAFRCAGYVDGIMDGADGLRGFCASNASTGTIVRVYIAYMDKNPKMFDEREGTGFMSALQEAYPCPMKR